MLRWVDDLEEILKEFAGQTDDDHSERMAIARLDLTGQIEGELTGAAVLYRHTQEDTGIRLVAQGLEVVSIGKIDLRRRP